MQFQEEMSIPSLNAEFRRLAHILADATDSSMRSFAGGNVTDEDDITPFVLGEIKGTLSRQGFGPAGVRWEATVLRHRRGNAAQEQATGADILIHVELKTAALRYSKGVLIQAKRAEPGDSMSTQDKERLGKQCERMLGVTPESFVADYARGGARFGSANRIVGWAGRDLYAACDLTPYRFFLDLLSCSKGDRSITSARFDELAVNGIVIAGNGRSIA